MSSIEGIPEGWELVRVGKPKTGEFFIDGLSCPHQAMDDEHFHGCAIIRKIEKPKQYRPFANAAEYVANRREGFAVDWNLKDSRPGFYAVVAANSSFVWVAFGDANTRFDWAQAFEKLMFRHIDNTTSPFGVEVTE